MTNQVPKKEPVLLRWLKRGFFGGQRELTVLEEEALQSPFRTVLKNFWARRISRIKIGRAHV